ncbi:hypothetical protein Pst134EB_025385 [Puccinia striiformis f. sp. tritici]|nr:hypothetical protein Pst134EB_025385 [Puccinia striiformis f. sp. tritici]
MSHQSQRHNRYGTGPGGAHWQKGPAPNSPHFVTVARAPTINTSSLLAQGAYPPNGSGPSPPYGFNPNMLTYPHTIELLHIDAPQPNSLTLMPLNKARRRSGGG